MSDRHLFTDVLIGAAAGLAATWVMGKVTTVLLEREPEEAKRRENEARGDRTAYEIAAEKGAAIIGRDLTDDQRSQLGNALHWILGAKAGAMYGLLRNRMDLGLGSGLVYGATFWAAVDEGSLTVLGLTPPPQEFPWQTHARGLVGHVVLGAVIEAVFDAIDLAE